MGGLAIVLVVFGGIGAWSVFAKLDGAVVATGAVTVESNQRTVQHLEGGIVGKLHVREGQFVDRGQLLLQLDGTIVTGQLRIVEQQLTELLARESRLRAEQADLGAVSWHPDLSNFVTDVQNNEIIHGQKLLFEARKQARNEEQDVLQTRIHQLNDEINGLSVQVTANSEQIRLIQQELDGLRKLYERGHVPITRILLLERQYHELKGEKGAFLSEIAKAKNRIGETRIEINRGRSSFREEVIAEMRDVNIQIKELFEERLTTLDQNRRLRVVAPQAGYVLGLAAHTEGGVIQAGQAIMNIVPENDELVVEVHVEPKDIDKVALASSTRVRFSAFNQRTTPEIEGKVVRISGDRIISETDQLPYYLVRIGIEKPELKRLNNLDLVPGMPVEALIRTGERSFLSYLLKPVLDAFSRSFRED
ncbi:MAG: HlyD family type I secretion periplasmic adaptor subunit [Pseudomonadota bacterium]